MILKNQIVRKNEIMTILFETNEFVSNYEVYVL